jgi:hypothetical protein
MNIGKWARLLLAAAPLLAGCANFWQAPASTTTTTTTTTLSGGIFYVLNVETSQIVAYDIVSGVLTKLATYPAPGVPLALAVSPNGGFLYLSTVNGIYVYTVSSSGTLAIGNSSGVISSDQAQSMRVDATNTWLIESVSGLQSLCAIPLSASTGLGTSTTEPCTTLSATTTQQLTISPDNKHVFVAEGTGGTDVVSFTSGNTNPLGTAGNIRVKNTGGAALSVAVDPQNRLFYIGETLATSGSNSGGVRAFTYASLPALGELSGSPYASQGLAPYSARLHRRRYLRGQPPDQQQFQRRDCRVLVYFRELDLLTDRAQQHRNGRHQSGWPGPGLQRQLHSRGERGGRPGPGSLHRRHHHRREVGRHHHFNHRNRPRSGFCHRCSAVKAGGRG